MYACLLGAMMCFMDTQSGRCHEYHCYCSSCVGMSMDAFAASIGKSATLHKPKFSEALNRPYFGAVETLTPLIGWGMGMLASRFCP